MANQCEQCLQLKEALAEVIRKHRDEKKRRLKAELVAVELQEQLDNVKA